MWHCVIRSVSSSVSKEGSTPIFKGRLAQDESKMSGITKWVTSITLQEAWTLTYTTVQASNIAQHLSFLLFHLILWCGNIRYEGYQYTVCVLSQPLVELYLVTCHFFCKVSAVILCDIDKELNHIPGKKKMDNSVCEKWIPAIRYTYILNSLNWLTLNQ
jgi:hypothetical protein